MEIDRFDGWVWMEMRQKRWCWVQDFDLPPCYQIKRKG